LELWDAFILNPVYLELLTSQPSIYLFSSVIDFSKPILRLIDLFLKLGYLRLQATQIILVGLCPAALQQDFLKSPLQLRDDDLLLLNNAIKLAFFFLLTLQPQ